MNYSQVIKLERHIVLLMESIGIFRSHREFIKINHYPDFDITPPKSNIHSTYYFNNYYSYPSDYTSIYELDIKKYRIYHYDNLNQLGREGRYNQLLNSCEDNTELLNECLNFELSQGNDSEFFDDYGFGHQVGNFKVYNLEHSESNDRQKRYYISGNFDGDNFDIDPSDWAIYAEIEFFGLASSQHENEFFSDLLVKAYTSYLSEEYRNTFFLAYSAFEGFVNQNQRSELEAERLSDKLNKLFKSKFSDISRHQIYTTLSGKLNGQLTTRRNDIAHGRKSDFDKNLAREMLIVSLFLISSYENCADKFSDLLR